MNKKLHFGLLFILFSLPVKSETIKSDDFADLQPKHWAYREVRLIVDNYGLLGGFPDHTFRGNREIDRYELSAIILKLLKNIEKEKKINLKQKKFTLLEPLNDLFLDVPKKHWSIKIIRELDEKYKIVLSLPEEKSFSGSKKINRYELALAIEKVFLLLEKVYNQPEVVNSEENTEDQKEEDLEKTTKLNWYDSAVDLVQLRQIMIGLKNGNFEGEKNVNRYQLTVTLYKTVKYIEENY